MNARQFFDVFPMVVEQVRNARASCLDVDAHGRLLWDRIAARHPESVTKEAVEQFRKIFEGTKMVGPR